MKAVCAWKEDFSPGTDKNTNGDIKTGVCVYIIPTYMYQLKVLCRLNADLQSAFVVFQL